MKPFVKVCALILQLFGLLLPVSIAMADVNITGLEGDAKSNVELLLSLRKETCTSPKWKVQGLFAQAGHEIDVALRAVGYYQPSIKKELRFNGDCWTANFDVQAGKPVTIKDIDIAISGDAAQDPEFKKLKDKANQSIGKPLNHADYEKLKSRIESLAMSRGYLHGAFTEHQLVVDPKQNSAVYKLAYDTKKRMVFGAVTIEQSTLRPDFVDKYIPIKPGQFYSSDKLAKTYQALAQSGYFANVDIMPNTETKDKSVPVNIKLQAKKKHHYELGVGFDTDIGPLLSAAYNNRRLNDRGHFLTSELNLSPVLSTAEVQYNVPLAAPITDFFSIGSGLKREDTDSYKSFSGTISARFNHALSKGWKQILFLDYSYEDFSTASESGQTLLLIPGASWQRSVADNPVRPTRAYRTKFDISGSYKNPLSDVSFLQAAFSGIWLQPLPFNGKFIGRGDFGAMVVDQFHKLPTTYRFYAGGLNSVRGYDYKELGPKNKFGIVEGGQFLAVLSAEYEQAILENWGVAGFIDSGNAFNIDKISFKTGVGLGVRWYSPFGPIRVDFALPLNDSKSSFQIHFAAGTRL